MSVKSIIHIVLLPNTLLYGLVLLTHMSDEALYMGM